jgi:hypothetical protein
MVSPKPTGTTPPPLKKKKGDSSGDPDGNKDSGRKSSNPKPTKSRSPSRRRSSRRDTDKPRERVVERVVRDSGSSGNWPQLTETDYVEWSLRMKLKLQDRDLWDVVEFGDGDYRDDRTALEAICSVVPSEMIPALAVKETMIRPRQRHRPLQPHCRPLHQHLQDQSHVAELKRYNKRCTRYFVNLNSILMTILCYLSLIC